MAKTITLKSNSYDGRYMKLVCEQTPNGSAKNSSTIKWTLSSVDGNETYYATGPTTVIINGTTVYSSGRVKWTDKVFPAAKGSKSGEVTISHANDGTKTINVSFSTAIYTSTVTTYSASWTLDSIPRYATSNQSLNTKTETTIIMNWSSDSTVDYLWYSLDNGSSWSGINVTDGKSGTYTISGLSPNTTYKVKTRIRRKDSQLTTDSTALSVTTYGYPYCTDSPNFILGNAVTLKFYNPLGRTFKFYIIGNGTQINEDYDCSSTTYTGITSTTTSVPYLYATIPNATSGKYKVKVVYGDHTHTRDNGNTYTIKESECYPTFTSFTYKDTNDTVAKVTGSNQILVQGVSSVSVEIPVANKMVAKNSATPNKYIATIDSTNKTLSYSSTSAVSVAMGTISTSGTKRISVTAYDSRGLPKTAHKDVTVYEYSKPIINVSAKRLNNFEATTTLQVSGSYSRLTIGGADKNTIKSVEYRTREAGGTWGSWTTLSATLSSGKFTCSDKVLTLDNAKAFEIEVKVEDALTVDTTESANVDIGRPIFLISSNKKTAYINYDEIATKNYVTDLLNALHPIGSVVCTSTNTNPSATYGGTWELIDKGFISSSGDITEIFTPATNVVTTGAYLSRGHSTIRIRLSIQINASLNDNGMTLGKFNWDKVGVSQLPFGYNEQIAYSDAAQGALTFNIAYNTGEVKQLDVFDTEPIPSGNTFALDITFNAPKNVMLDSFCDKFYWKRTT